MLLSLYPECLHSLRQTAHLRLQLANLALFVFAGETADRLDETSIEDSSSRIPDSNKLAFLGEQAPSENSADPGLDCPNCPSQML